MPKQIVYASEEDTKEYDFNRYLESLRRYGEVDDERVKAAVKSFGDYDPMHVSCLVEIGTSVLEPEEAAEKYFRDHGKWFDELPEFDRLRRITGYLVGSLSRWNDSKVAEEAARVKHSIGLNNSWGVYTQDQKAAREVEKESRVSENQNEYHK